MSNVAGIDLGTTNSLIGVMDAGFPIILADGAGERSTPSVVHYPETGEPVVGRAAVRMRALEADRTVSSVKRFMGRRGEEALEDAAQMHYRVETPTGEPAMIRLPGARGLVSPVEVSAQILSKLKANADRALERPVERAVITVPAYFNDAQRQATKAAGERAGLVVERIINEPTAAALAYGLDKLSERSKVAVFDLGGGTFDISILELNGGVFQVLATHGNTRLGGDDIDRALVDFCLDRLAEIHELPHLTAQALARLRESVVEAKHVLSGKEVTTIELPFLEGDRSLELELRRSDLERVARPIVDRTRAHCGRALADAGLSAEALDKVILVGGATRMPIVRRLVADVFGREPDTSQNPDEAVAVGATIQAGILSGVLDRIVLLDVTPLSLGIETFGGLMNVIIPRNSTIPLKRGEMFTNALPRQTSMIVRILQGEREMARDNWPLGEIEIPFEPAPKGQARVGVQFEIDADGILQVLVRDTRTGREEVAEIRSAVDVSDEAVEKMIAESVEYAFDDMSERVLTEARLKSEEMLPAVRRALSDVGGQLEPQEREAIERLLGEVEAAVQSGEVARLKRANKALDEGTQNLATLLIEKAMEDSLRRKGVL